MHRLNVWLLLVAMAPASVAATDAESILEDARLALSGSRDSTPVRVEIEAVYRYADSEQLIRDRTILEPGRRLFQEREIAGQMIRREWTPEGAFLESSLGRESLDETMRAELEAYFCLRQLELLVLCPGVEARQLASSPERLVIEIRRAGEKFAELEIDAKSRRLAAMRYDQSLTEEELSSGEAEVRYFEFRDAADGWSLPHRVETTSAGALKSSYSVERWKVEMKPTRRGAGSSTSSVP